MNFSPLEAYIVGDWARITLVPICVSIHLTGVPRLRHQRHKLGLGASNLQNVWISVARVWFAKSVH